MQWFEAISRHSENEIDLADLGLAAFVLVSVVKAIEKAGRQFYGRRNAPSSRRVTLNVLTYGEAREWHLSLRQLL